jgi:signal transduction histidine kinase
MGIQGMRERAALIGGHLEITSRDGAGTRVSLTVSRRSGSPGLEVRS